MQIEIKKICDLKDPEYSARKRLCPGDTEYKQIWDSICEFGLVDPVVVNADGTIIGGRQRVNVLRDNGHTEVPAVVIDLPKDKERALSIALNKITGRWDEEKLLALLGELQAADYSVELTGFDEKEIAELMRRTGADEIEDDGFDCAAAYNDGAPPITERGDVWQLGDHRIMCGDATSGEDVSVLMDGERARLIVTDPPYNVDYEGEAGKILNDHMSDAAFYNFLLAAFQNMLDAAEPGAAAYVFHADTQGLAFRRAFVDSGFSLRQCLIWVKNSFVLGRQDYHWRHEPILYGWRPGAAHHFAVDRTQSTVLDAADRPNLKTMKKAELLDLLTKICDTADDGGQSVIYCDRPANSVEHPTMKPLPLLGRLISNSSLPGWIISDFFSGSGSTLLACEKLKRSCRAMELDQKNIDVTVKRWEALTGGKAERP